MKLLEQNPGDSGWEIFSLNYSVDEPLNTILTPEVMFGYLKIFSFLWKLKRVEHTLSESWRMIATRRHDMSCLVEIRQDLHACNLLRHEMMYFITNLNSFMQVEVLESALKTFTDDLNAADNLDQI